MWTIKVHLESHLFYISHSLHVGYFAFLTKITTRLDRHKHRGEDNIKMYLMKQGVSVWTEFIWLRIRPLHCSCEHGNEPSSSMKWGGGVLSQMNDYIKQDSAALSL
jgi:hypothetical protein